MSQDTKGGLQHLYIQMEFCENSTLRSAIDEGLYKNQERIWRLLREIVEGLVHVHSQVSQSVSELKLSRTCINFVYF